MLTVSIYLLLATAGAFIEILIIGAIARTIAELFFFCSKRIAGIVGVAVAVGFVLGRTEYSGPPNLEALMVLARFLGSLAAVFALWHLLLKRPGYRSEQSEG